MPACVLAFMDSNASKRKVTITYVSGYENHLSIETWVHKYCVLCIFVGCVVLLSLHYHVGLTSCLFSKCYNEAKFLIESKGTTAQLKVCLCQPTVVTEANYCP